MTDSTHEQPVEVSPAAFKLVVWCALAPSLLCFAGCFFCTFWLASKRGEAFNKHESMPEINETLEDISKLNEALRYTLTIGFGAVIGLVGSKHVK
jgi:hypothetical protein